MKDFKVKAYLIHLDSFLRGIIEFFPLAAKKSHFFSVDSVYSD